MKRAEWAEWRFDLSVDRRQKVAAVLGRAVDRSMVGRPDLLGPATVEGIREIAGEWGVSFSTLYRLLRAKSPSVSWNTLLRIKGHLEPGEAKGLEEAALPPAVTRAFEAWYGYVQEEWARAVGGTGSPDVERERLPARERRLLEEFENRVESRGLLPLRTWLAHRRVYRPLVPWEELRRAMPAAARLRIVALGWRREMALLTEEIRLLRKSTV